MLGRWLSFQQNPVLDRNLLKKIEKIFLIIFECQLTISSCHSRTNKKKLCKNIYDWERAWIEIQETTKIIYE